MDRLGSPTVISVGLTTKSRRVVGTFNITPSVLKSSHSSLISFFATIAAANELRFQSFAETHRTKQARYLMTPDEILDMPEDRQILFTSGRNLKPIYAAKRHYDERREFAGRFLPHPFHAPSDAVLIPRMFGRRRARLIREPVPDKFAHFPQYRDGYWSYIEGYRPN